jgi:high-affinity iron transporter
MDLIPLVGSFFIILREGFEALLIVSLVFAYLEKLNEYSKAKYVWLGIITGIVASIAIALGFNYIATLTHEHEEWFEGITMFIAAGMLTYVAIWCHGAQKHFEDSIITKGTVLALSASVCFAILREGFEIVLFYAALFSSPIAETSSIVVGGLIGVVTLVVIYFLMQRVTNLIPTKTFFNISKYILIVLALYFMYSGWLELEEVMFGAVNPSNLPVWYCEVRPMVCYH